MQFDLNKDAYSSKEQKRDGSIEGFVHAELSLLSALPKNFKKAFKENLEANSKTLATEAAVGLVAGVALAALTRNPALLGKAAGKLMGANPLILGEASAKVVAPLMKTAPKIFGGLATYDAGNRLGIPAYDLMKHPEHQLQDEKQFASNFSGLIQDYSITGVSGFAGAKFAFNRTSPFINRGPMADTEAVENWRARNPDKLNKASRLSSPQDYVFAEEKHLAPDVYEHYSNTFPPAEQQPKESYEEMIAKGANTVMTLREKATGQLAAAHILGFHEQPDPTIADKGIIKATTNWLKGTEPEPLRSVHGDFIFVREDLRGSGKGVGSFMYDKVVNYLQEKGLKEGKPYVALTGEMEDPKETAEGLISAIYAKPLPAVANAGHPEALQEASSILKEFKENFPSINLRDPNTNPQDVGNKLKAMLGKQQDSQGESHEIGQTLIDHAERISRQQFYWSLPVPKVDSGAKWFIQDFEDPAYRGQAHWTTVTFAPEKFLPKETAYAFMTDEAGYNLSPKSAQVKEFMKRNNYYRAPLNTPYNHGLLLGGLNQKDNTFESK